MIKSVDETKIVEIAKFAYRLNQTKEHCCSGYITDYEGMLSRFKKRIANPNDEVLVCYKDNKMVGSLNLIVTPSEKYIEATEGIYVEDNYAEIALEFFDYIKEKYTGYQLDTIIPNTNIEAIRFMESLGAECEGDDILMKLKLEEVHYNESDMKLQDKILQLNEKYFDEFIKFHDNIHTGIYWTGKRLVEAVDLFNIFIAVVDDKVVASTVSRKYKGKGTGVLFVGTDINYRRLGYAKALIKVMLNKAIEEGAKAATIEVHKDNFVARRLYESFGFREACIFLAYTINSI